MGKEAGGGIIQQLTDDMPVSVCMYVQQVLNRSTGITGLPSVVASQCWGVLGGNLRGRLLQVMPPIGGGSH